MTTSAAIRQLIQNNANHQALKVGQRLDFDKIKEENLVRKNALIEEINTISANVSSNHGKLQQQIKKIEEIREDFFKAVQVPQKLNSKTWNSFKTAVRNSPHTERGISNQPIPGALRTITVVI